MIINHEVTRVAKDGEDCTITNDKLEEFGIIFYEMCKLWHSSIKASFHLIATVAAMDLFGDRSHGEQRYQHSSKRS